VHDANEPLKLEDVVLDELLIDILYSGICGPDMGLQQGHLRVCPYPAIFGHEDTGRILAIGGKVKNKELRVRDRVLLSINYCERCKFCLDEHPADCTEGTRLHLFGVRADGTTAAKLEGMDTSLRFHFFGQSSFATTSFVHETSAVKVPD
jgi:Zn-dependent alcohol dehydrogenase